ncbi:hypothetical protein Pcinc_004793 [Petrolisthes cinctipes]|uniref:RNA-directed DNA polymerase n=1 Tax=Petrolisthes cinctipes TaxID=88211 RepID=A0AAE1GG93_PETCI|nr:hypothetical protein Pcinc_004793 [Petrolisthes cinctipes]
MPAPGDLTHLRGFLCTVNFLARYLPKLATVSEPLRQLLKKNVPYVWSDAHEKSFNAVKELVTRAPILRYYDPRIDVVLQCDARRELWIADTLSRQLPCPTVKPGAFAINLAEHELAIDLAVTAECLQEYRTTSSQDSELQAVVVAIRSGDWSMPAVAEYTPVKSELSTDGVLVFKGARLVVPRTLRSRVLQQLHAAHMGIEATRRRARESVFWPGLNGHIKDMVSRCSTCAAVQPSQARNPCCLMKSQLSHGPSNGKAENAVHTIKKLLSKSEMSNTDPLLAILEWRNTPSEATGTSPAQKLFGRRCRTPLPVSTGLLMPVVEDTKAMVQKAKEKQVQYYNRGTKLLPDSRKDNQ